MEPDDLPHGEAPAPEQAAAALRVAAEQLEAACLAELQAILERFGCELYAAPMPVGELYLLRVGVRLRQWERS